MTETIDKKIALVTGAGRGIGKSIAELLATKGHHVICVSRSAGSCGAVADAINAAGGSAQSLAVDVADNAAVLAASEQLLEEHGNIDILVNNAGITKDTLILRMSEDDFATVLDANLTAAFRVCKRATQGMLRARSGRIILISSVVGMLGSAGQANYAASKSGLVGLGRSLARELGSRSITVNVVAPGPVETDMTAALTAEQLQTITSSVPLQRMATPEEVAGVVAFLASQPAAYITGAVIPVDGGLGMGH